MNMTKKCESCSLGRGMGPTAEKFIEEGLNRGGWVLLMNCHLSTSWMPKLEELVENMDDTKHRDFRLWLTSMPNKSFPVSILQNSVKMTLEPPSGLKQNVLSTYESLDVEEFESCSKPQVFKKLLFGFAFFHAIVQDRRKFGPIGWNIPYAFTNEDLTVSRRQLKIFIETYEEVPYKVLNYIGAEINYGGRVTDDKDVRLIKVILQGYMNEKMLEDDYFMSKSGTYKSIPFGKEIDSFIAVNDPRCEWLHRQETVFSPHGRHLVVVDRRRHLFEFLRHHDLTDKRLLHRDELIFHVSEQAVVTYALLEEHSVH